MARRTVLSPDEETEINLSSMIDCIFILLIFFIVTTVFVEEQGLSVNKPDAAAIASPEEKENIVLEITQQNKILLNDKEITLADIPGQVKSKLTDSEIPIVIRAHEKSSHGVFVGVWDAAKQGGAGALSFSTVN